MMVVEVVAEDLLLNLEREMLSSCTIHLDLGQLATERNYSLEPALYFRWSAHRSGHPVTSHHRVRRTPGISCEAVPAFCRGGAGMRRHLRLSAACGARVGAAESFVSFIPLLGGLGRSLDGLFSRQN
jgi:hypothetical protein